MRSKMSAALLLGVLFVGAAGAAWAFAKPSTVAEQANAEAFGCCVTGDCCCPGEGSCCDPTAKANAKLSTKTAKKGFGCCVTGDCCCPGQGSCCADFTVKVEVKGCCAKKAKAEAKGCCEAPAKKVGCCGNASKATTTQAVSVNSGGCCVTGNCCCPLAGLCCDPFAASSATISTVAVNSGEGCCATGNCCCPFQGLCCDPTAQAK